MHNLTVIENELVPVYKTSTGEKVVYGSELHTVLEVKSKFADLSDLSVELRAIIMHDKKIQRMENRMDKLEYDIPLYGSEADELCNHVKRKGVEMLGGKTSNSYRDTKIRSAVYTDIYN